MVTIRSIRYSVPSASGNGAYIVSEDPTTHQTACSCKAGSYGRDCWHQKAIRAGMVKPRVQVRPLAPAHDTCINLIAAS